MKTKTLVALMLLSGAAQAYEAGDILVRAGLATVEPDDSSSAIAVTDPGVAAGTKTGTAVSVDSDTQIGLEFTYFLTPHIAVDVLGATPFEHNISADGNIKGLGKLGSTKHLPPTVSIQYYPMPSGSKFQPYVGAGLNYTIFFEEETTSTLTNSIGALASLPQNPVAGVVASSTELELDDSFGYALQLGMDYQMTEQFAFNAGLWYIDIDTTGTITADTNVGKVKAEVDVDIDPWVYMVGFSLKI